MYKTTILNKETGLEYTASFNTIEECEAWKNKLLNGYGRLFGEDEKELIVDKNSYSEELTFIEEVTEQEPKLNDEGVPEVAIVDNIEVPILQDVIRDRVLKPADFVFTIEEVQKSVEDIIEEQLIYKEFGQKVQLYFAGLMQQRNFSQAKKDAVQQDVNILNIMNQLNFGRIAKSRTLLNNLEVDENIIYQEDLDKIIIMMDEFLALYI